MLCNFKDRMTLRLEALSSTGNIFANKYRLRNGQSSGRQYDIKGLYTFLRSGDCPKGIDVPEEVAQDLREYGECCEARKRQFADKKNSRLKRKTE